VITILLIFNSFLFGLSSDSLKLIEANSFIFEENNGMVAVEAENYSEQLLNKVREWKKIDMNCEQADSDPDTNHSAKASAGAYLEILPDTRITHKDVKIDGVNFSNVPGKLGVLNYRVFFNTPGKYFVWVRAYSTGTEDNGIHVGIDDLWPESGQRMQWCKGKNRWTWESMQRRKDNHCGEPETIFLFVEEAGLHTISFSMREDGFEFDQWIMTLEYKKPIGTGPDQSLYKTEDF